ncbi:hypothetical protein [Larkinella soli]|uniref:hypothetical protein n=1 Tax=Larkinella soli TaxID=1770527 RepID=UPI000FFB91FC|nr:hypothetical protein [Larkinella soli]
MRTVSYDSIKADQAWVAVTQHLQRRNQLLADGVSFLELHPSDHALAGRLVVLQYHLRATVRRLVTETSQARPMPSLPQLVRRQWLVVHQLTFLLRQIDDELRKTGAKSPAFRSWMDQRNQRFTCKPSPRVYLN